MYENADAFVRLSNLVALMAQLLRVDRTHSVPLSARSALPVCHMYTALGAMVARSPDATRAPLDSAVACSAGHRGGFGESELKQINNGVSEKDGSPFAEFTIMERYQCIKCNSYDNGGYSNACNACQVCGQHTFVEHKYSMSKPNEQRHKPAYLFDRKLSRTPLHHLM